MKNFLQNFIKQFGFQPILTIVLIIIFLVFVFQFFNKSTDTQLIRESELVKKVSFEDAANRFLNEDFEVFTRGVLYVKDNSFQTVSPETQLQSSPTRSITQISLVENKYEDVFFLSNKGDIIKVDAKTFGINGSIFFNKKSQLIFLDNVNKQFTAYKIPADSEANVVKLFEGIKYTFKENIFPLGPLVNDYKSKKFNPIENSSVPNIYSGKWQHPVYTSNEIVNIVLQTDPNTGMFNAMFITGTNPPSQLFFDFKKINSIEDYDQIPPEYKSIPVPSPYKEKEGQ